MVEKEESKVMRKPVPSMRANIHVATLNKIKSFLKEQMAPVYKAEIVRNTGVNYDSLKMALTMIKYKTDSEGRIYVGRKNV